jgi:hypothetical protein
MKSIYICSNIKGKIFLKTLAYVFLMIMYGGGQELRVFLLYNQWVEEHVTPNITEWAEDNIIDFLQQSLDNNDDMNVDVVLHGTYNVGSITEDYESAEEKLLNLHNSLPEAELLIRSKRPHLLIYHTNGGIKNGVKGIGCLTRSYGSSEYQCVRAGNSSQYPYTWAIWDSDSWLFTHEFGHNFGCQDPDYESGPEIGYINEEIPFATNMIQDHGSHIPYFSNPVVNYEGVPVGVENENDCGGFIKDNFEEFHSEVTSYYDKLVIDDHIITTWIPPYYPSGSLFNIINISNTTFQHISQYLYYHAENNIHIQDSEINNLGDMSFLSTDGKIILSNTDFINSNLQFDCSLPFETWGSITIDGSNLSIDADAPVWLNQDNLTIEGGSEVTVTTPNYIESLGSIDIKEGDTKVNLISADFIKIKPGFHVVTAGGFHAKINAGLSKKAAKKDRHFIPEQEKFEEESGDDFAEFNCVNGQGILNFNLLEEANISLRIFDLNGKKVFSKYFRNRTPGQYNETVDLTNLSNNIYVYHLSAGNLQKAHKFAISK